MDDDTARRVDVGWLMVGGVQEANGQCDHRNARSPQEGDNPEEMNAVGKRGAYRGHEPTYKLSKGFLQTALLTGGGRSSAFNRRCFCWHGLLSVGNSYRQNKQLLRLLGENKILAGAAASEMTRQMQKGISSRVVLVRFSRGFSRDVTVRHSMMILLD
jgi:hypothetical protein